jgi:hypothetical protein
MTLKTLLTSALTASILLLPASIRADDSPPATGAAKPRPKIKTYNTAHYQMHTDVGDDVAREAYLRMDRMFDEYANRTSGFARLPSVRFPFYLVGDQINYYGSGGLQGSAGSFIVHNNQPKLLALADDETLKSGYLWHILQHEGFHQFAFYGISPWLPVWINEGTAEFFGEARFTGDGFVSGMIPDERRQRVADMIRGEKFTPFSTFIAVDSDSWNASMSSVNYDQAWSMVQFLVGGDGGKYQAPFVKYMSMLSHGSNSGIAWTQVFGRDTDAFQDAWSKFWTTMPANPSADKEVRARLMIFDSFIARAQIMKHHYKTFDAFWTDAQAGTYYIPEDANNWLPKEVIDNAISDQSIPALDPATVTLTWQLDHPVLTERLEDKSSLVVTYSQLGDRGHTAVVLKPPPVVKGAKPADKPKPAAE